MSLVWRISNSCGAPGGGPASPASGVATLLSLQAAEGSARARATTASSGSHLPWRCLLRPRPRHPSSSMSDDLSAEGRFRPLNLIHRALVFTRGADEKRSETEADALRWRRLPCSCCPVASPADGWAGG